jgi:hypothetical protein
MRGRSSGATGAINTDLDADELRTRRVTTTWRRKASLCAGGARAASTLIWTDLDAYAMSYLGLPFVYDVQRMGENAGIISRGAHAAADGRVFWWGPNGF